MGDQFTAEELPPLLTPKQLAAFINSTEAALAQERYLGKGIAYTRIGKRIRYMRADVIAHLAANRITGPNSAA